MERCQPAQPGFGGVRGGLLAGRGAAPRRHCCDQHPGPVAPPLAALVDRRVRLARSISELEAGGHSGDTVVYVYSASRPVGDDLVDLFRRAKTIKMDATGVELTIP
jgi:hypothetical protein